MALTSCAVRTALAWWRPTVGTLRRHHAPRPFVLDPATEARHSIGAVALPSVSIVTPSYNQGRYLARNIDSVAGQNYPRLEHIVVDGGSSDETVTLLEDRRQVLARWISEADDGQADALNKGMRCSSGEILGYLNADDWLLPGCVSVVAGCFNACPDVDVVYGNRVLVNEEDCAIGSWILPAHSPSAFLWLDFIPQETMFWRRSLWNKIGASFDVSLRYALDWDLIRRFANAGASFMHLPRFLAAFRVHSDQKSQQLSGEAGRQETRHLLTAMHNRDVSLAERLIRSSSYLIRQRLEEMRRANDYLRLLAPVSQSVK